MADRPALLLHRFLTSTAILLIPLITLKLPFILSKMPAEEEQMLATNKRPHSAVDGSDENGTSPIVGPAPTSYHEEKMRS